MKTLSIDIETYSSVDLAKCGVYKYTEATDFDILLFGYSADGNPVQIVDLASGETIPPEVIAALTNDDVTKWAFNAQFERICLSRWFRDHGVFDNAYYSIPEDTVGNYLDPTSWKCTMIWSAYMGLPLSLEGVGAVLGLGKQKLTEGKELIKYFCQPCAPTKTNGGRTRNLPENAPDKWDAFKRYNIRDVEVEMSIQEKLTKFPVPETVWEQYHLDQEINDRGVALDMELVHQAIAMDTRSRADLTAAMKKLTALDNPNSVQQMKQWLSDNGLEADSLGKKEVAEMLRLLRQSCRRFSFSGSSWPNRLSKSIRRWKRQSAPMVVLVECFSSTVPTGPVVGLDALYRCRTCPRTIFRIWQRLVGLSAAATLKAWSFSTKMCRIHSLN